MRIVPGLLVVLAVASVAAADPVMVERETTCGTKNKQASEAYNRGYRAQRSGELDAAEREYRSSIVLDPGYCDAMDNLGQVFRARHDDAHAIEWYLKSIALAPQNATAHQSLAAAYTRAERWDDAAREYDRLIAIDAGDPEGPYGKGAMLFLAKRYREAVAPLAAAETLYAKARSPLVADARYVRGLVHAELGEWPKARELLEPLAAAHDGDRKLHFALGRVYLSPALRDPAKARSHLERARALGATVPDELMRQAQP